MLKIFVKVQWGEKVLGIINILMVLMIDFVDVVSMYQMLIWRKLTKTPTLKAMVSM